MINIVQEDGTWTDVPRCIEHEPGMEEQFTGVCPGVPGYCSLDLPGGLCTFQCPIGPPVRSSCTEDGTWEPYPTCEGDPRETQDGCDPCPGPNGGPRNRTVEAGGGRNGGGNNGFGGNPRKSGNGGGNTRKNGNGGGNSRNSGANTRNGANAGNGRKSGGNNRNNNNNGAHKPTNNRNSQNTRKNVPARSNNKKNKAPAQQPRSNGGFSPRSSGGGGGGNSLSCPGDVLQACIDVCPGFSARVFAACVSGCAKRCPGKK